MAKSQRPIAATIFADSELLPGRISIVRLLQHKQRLEAAAATAAETTTRKAAATTASEAGAA